MAYSMDVLARSASALLTIARDRQAVREELEMSARLLAALGDRLQTVVEAHGAVVPELCRKHAQVSRRFVSVVAPACTRFEEALLNAESALAGALTAAREGLLAEIKCILNDFATESRRHREEYEDAVVDGARVAEQQVLARLGSATLGGRSLTQAAAALQAHASSRAPVGAATCSSHDAPSYSRGGPSDEAGVATDMHPASVMEASAGRVAPGRLSTGRATGKRQKRPPPHRESVLARMQTASTAAGYAASCPLW